MARFDVYLGKRGYLLDVQADSLDLLDTRIVAPLLPNAMNVVHLARLHPVFRIDGRALVMATHLLAAVRKSSLGTRLASLAPEADVITRALDMALQGF